MEKCAKGGSFQVSSVQLQNFTNSCSFRMYLMLLNLVDKLKCEIHLTLLSTYSCIYLSQWRCFWAPLWELAPTFLYPLLCKISQYL